jgi:colicin import membrane protein
MSSLAFGQRYEPGYGRSFALAFAIHAVLIAVMFFGVRMQSYQPETVSVELWEPPPPPLPSPVVEPPKPQPKIEPEPPKPEPKIEKPEILEKPAPKPKPKADPKPKPKPPPPLAKPKPAPRDLELEKRAREELAREQSEFRERQAKAQARDQAAREQEAARISAMAAWVSRIRNKIRGNINLPQDLTGNPEAIFDVALLPTGEVLTVRMRKSSGHRGYDEAVERAILKSSPLPKPEPASLFDRQLELRFRPQDQ